MRRLTPAVLATIVFWSSYAIVAAYAVYEETPPLGRVLMLVLGGYAAMLAVLTLVLWARTPLRTSRRRSRSLIPGREDCLWQESMTARFVER